MGGRKAFFLPLKVGLGLFALLGFSEFAAVYSDCVPVREKTGIEAAFPVEPVKNFWSGWVAPERGGKVTVEDFFGLRVDFLLGVGGGWDVPGRLCNVKLVPEKVSLVRFNILPDSSSMSGRSFCCRIF